jgi:hypothetical protein
MGLVCASMMQQAIGNVWAGNFAVSGFDALLCPREASACATPLHLASQGALISVLTLKIPSKLLI